MPLWAYTLAAHVPASWEPLVVDAALDPVTTAPSADVFAYTAINQDLESVLAAHAALRAQYPSARHILGGPITWSFEQAGRLEELRGFDHLFVLDGEASLPALLADLDAGRTPDRIIRGGRFPLGGAKPVRFDLLQPVASRYYGAVIEVSRGCPFLCEFCDIRVLPENNETHTKDPAAPLRISRPA